MEISGVGKSPNASLSFRYNANNEELEELCYPVCEDDPPTPQCDPPPPPSENASPKRGERSSIIDKYFKSMRTEKPAEKSDDVKPLDTKIVEDQKPSPVTKEVTSSPMKEYLNRFGKRSTSESPDIKEGSNETWKIFHDFKYKIAQVVDDMKTRSLEETKEKSVPRENSMSDSEENSAVKDSDQQSVGDTDNQVSSLDSSMQNLSEMTQPLTAKATEKESSLPVDNKNHSDSSDDTHKNLVYNESAEVTRDYVNDSSMEVESGIEALEDTIDGFGDIQNIDAQCKDKDNPVDSEHIQPPPTPVNNFGFPPGRNNVKTISKIDEPKHYFLNFSMYFLTFLICVNYILFPNSRSWNGFVIGLWFFCFWSNLKNYLLDTFFTDSDQKPGLLQLKRSSIITPTYTIPVVKEHRPMKKYEGWINHYRFIDYDPFTYHINKTTTAFMKLEGCNLRISYTRTKIAKRALWDEKIEKVAFYQHRLYNLTGARVILLPKGLVKRRQWSKKYPICVVLNEKETIQVLEKESSSTEKKTVETPSEKKKEQHEMETETNASPEKKKKFVWRRKEKSITHSEPEPGKEGLRHRLVKKIHRDKKTDSVNTATGTEPSDTQSQGQVQTDSVFLEESYQDADVELVSKSATSTKDEIEEELDENELTKLKDFIEETEREAGADNTDDGEWSVHVRQSSDKHSHLYLFARTGRDKHEWYRRLIIAISEANAASAETSATDDKSNSEPSAENKDGIEMAVYKLVEKDTVTFAKSNRSDSPLDSGTVFASISHSVSEPENYEKTFWPYLMKIIQNKSPSPDCQCRMLPSEVTWLNTLLARIMYDLMRDPVMISRLQNRIQRKLNTLKLPPFMSPLVITELSLAGACPLVERVATPAYDASGVWLDADLRYEGGAYIAILTQINLMKLKEKNATLEEQLLTTKPGGSADSDMASIFAENQLRSYKPAIFDSDVEDSAESSSDDESPPIQPVDSSENMPLSELSSTTSSVPADQGGSSKKKFLRMVDKIATNKYFQQVTDYKYVKRAMEGLSNTDIKLHLEVHALEGRLALNLPPPPHDRVWIGFRTNPQLILKARPAVGARTLRFAHITNWIEQKLSKEFEKVLVLPNMEDIMVDVMTPTPVQFE